MIKNGWIRDVDGAWWPLKDIKTIYPTFKGVYALTYIPMQDYREGIEIYKPLVREGHREIEERLLEQCSDYLDDMMGME